MRLPSQLPLVPGLEMSGAVPAFFLCAFMAWHDRFLFAKLCGVTSQQTVNICYCCKKTEPCLKSFVIDLAYGCTCVVLKHTVALAFLLNVACTLMK